MGDNGKLENGESKKTPEQLAIERLERYQKDPNSFTENIDIIVCVIRSPEGKKHLIQGNADELEISLARLNRKIMNILNNMEMRAEIAKSPDIQKVNHGIIDFMRRRK